MAISEDTAALVAAQLTTAWAIRMGVQTPDTSHPSDEVICKMYLRFRDHVAEKKIGGATQEPLGGV